MSRQSRRNQSLPRRSECCSSYARLWSCSNVDYEAKRRVRCAVARRSAVGLMAFASRSLAWIPAAIQLGASASS